MSFHINSDKEKIRGVNPKLIGDNELTIRGGTGSNEREILRTELDANTQLPRVGINRTGQKIDKITVDVGGTGYTSTPTVTIDAPPAGGEQATASAFIFNGRVTTIAVNNPGSGYAVAPGITISDGGGQGSTASSTLDTVEFELDINGAIRTSTSIISDTARILNLDIENFITPDPNFRAPNLKTFMNNTGTPWSPNVIVQKDLYRWFGNNVYQATNSGQTGPNGPEHLDGIEINGEVNFKHIGFRVVDSNNFKYEETGESGIFPRSITPLLGDRSDKIATTEYVLNLATNDVGGRIYVSSQIGSDLNDGRSAVSPVRTIKKAAQLAWATPGVKETLIVSGGDYVEDNPISLPPDASVVGDNLRLVIIRPANPKKHIFKFGDKNYVTGVTYRDQIDSIGDSVATWDFAMVFDDKQRIYIDNEVNGDFGVDFPIGHQIFGPEEFNVTFSNNTGLTDLTAGRLLKGGNTGARARVTSVSFNSTTGNDAFKNGNADIKLLSGSFLQGEEFEYNISATPSGTTYPSLTSATETDGQNSLLFTSNPINEISPGFFVRLTASSGTASGQVISGDYEVVSVGTSSPYKVTFAPILATNGWSSTGESIAITSGEEITVVTKEFDSVAIKSIRAEGEVVSVDEDTTSTLPISRIDFSLQGDPSIATGGFQFGQFGNAEDLGGLVFYTNALVGRDNTHDFKEGQEILIEGLPTSGPDLSYLNGKQRIYKVLEDADGRSRRFVIPKKVPGTNDANFQPGSTAVVKSFSKSVTLSLLNSPNTFPVATPVDRRFQDACTFLRNNREFIADEVVGKINDQFKTDHYSVFNIGGTPTAQFTPTDVTYNPATGDTVFTVNNHGLSEGDGIRITDESIVFTCTMDGNKTEHALPDTDQYASGKSLPITSKTANTFTVNVGASGPDVEFTPSGATYDPATGALELTIGSHTLDVGEGITIDDNSLSFTCSMDSNQTVKTYPRPGIDPFAGRSMPITAISANTITINAGISGPNKQFTPTDAAYDAATGDMVLTVGQHGLGVARNVTLLDSSLTFTCTKDGNASQHSYPRPGVDPYNGQQSIAITAVGSTQHTASDAPYDASTGVVTLTVASHGFANGDYVKIADDSLTYTCDLDGNVAQKSYPRAGYDYPSGRWLEISGVTTNTFDINVGSSSYTGTHTFVSAATNGIDRQDGTFTINVGASPVGEQYAHTFVSASANAVQHSPQSPHNFTGATANAVKHLPQSVHTFVRSATNALSVGGSSFDIFLGPLDHVNTYVSGGTVSFNGSTVNVSNFLYDTAVTGVGTITTATPLAGLAEDDTVKLADLLISCAAGEKLYPSYSSPTSGNNTGTDGDDQCRQDIIHFVNAVIRDLEFGTNYNVIDAASKYIIDGKIAFVEDEIAENIRAIEYAREICTYAIRNWRTGLGTVGEPIYSPQYSALTRYFDDTVITTTAGSPACANVVAALDTLSFLWVDIISNNASGTYLDAAYLIARNKDLIADQAYLDTKQQYPSLNLSDIHERKCRRDIKIVLRGLIRDLVLGGNHGIVSTAESYFSGVTLTGIPEAQRAETRYAFTRVKEYAMDAMRNWTDGTAFGVTPSGATYNSTSGQVTVTFTDPSVALTTSDRIAFSEEAITFSCNSGNHPSPERFDSNFGKSYQILSVSSNGGNTTATVNVGNAGSASGDAHTFVSAKANGTILIYDPVALTSPIPKFEDWNILLYTPTPLCANVASSITTALDLFDDILAGSVLPGATSQTFGILYDSINIREEADSILTDFNNVKVTIRADYDDYPIIEASPYTQNASVISFLGGGGAEIDGNKVKQPNCPFPGLELDGTASFPNQGKSMVAAAFTIVSFGGTGYKVINDGYVQLVSVFVIFCQDGILCETGGYASVTNSATNFGTFALRGTGFREEAYIFDSGTGDPNAGTYTRATVSQVTSTPTGRTKLRITNLGREPLEHYIIKFDDFTNTNTDIEYFIDVVEEVTVGPPFSALLTLDDGSGGAMDMTDKSTGQAVATSVLLGEEIALHRPSIVNSSSHTWEFAGSGNDYNALPENGGVKIEANEQVSEQYGRVYVSGTDELGDFKVGTFARIENRTGNITFTGTVTISEVEFLKLKGGDVVVTGFDASNTLGGANSTNSKLPTQKAVRDYITNNLGPYINKPFSTNAVPRNLVELTDSGKISIDQIPALSPFSVFTVADQAERTSIEGALAGDIAIQQDTSQSFILNNDVDSLFLGFSIDSNLSFTIGDVFTGSLSNGIIQATEYREGVLFQINISDGGSGYTSAPTVSISGGNPQAGAVQAAATCTIANGQVVTVTILAFNGYLGGFGYTTQPTITFSAAPGGGTTAQANALIESRLYGDIVNNIKITDTDTFDDSIPSPNTNTVNIQRVVNTSSFDNNNWVSLSSNQIAASDITSGVIETDRLAAGGSANSFSFLRGDSNFALAVQSLKGAETRYFAKLNSQVSQGASSFIFATNSDALVGHEVVASVAGIQANTNITGVLTVGGLTTVSINNPITQAIPNGSIIEFERGTSPLSFESTFTQGNFIDEVIIVNAGTGFTNGQYFDVSLLGGSGTGLKANFNVVGNEIIEITVTDGGSGYNNDFTVSTAPVELGTGSNLVLEAKISTVNRQYANVALDIQRVSELTISADLYGTVGVARFKKSQFNIGEVGNGSVEIKTGPDSGLDSDLLDGQQGSYYTSATNLFSGTVPSDRLAGSYNISISGSSTNTIRLASGTNNPTSNPSPDTFVTGVVSNTLFNTAVGLNDGGTKSMVLSLRPAGSGFTFDGGVKQLAFTDNDNMWLRGSGSGVVTFGSWAKIWTSLNDGVGSGLDADRFDNKQGVWYQNALNINYGTLSASRLPGYIEQTSIRDSIKLKSFNGDPKYKVYVSGLVLDTSSTGTFAPGNSVKLYDVNDQAVADFTIDNEITNNDLTDNFNDYTILIGRLTSGNFATAIRIGTATINVAFHDFTIEDSNTIEVAKLESNGANAELCLGRSDGFSSTPSIFFKSSTLAAANYNASIVASGGNATDGSGTLDITVANSDAVNINGNKIWNAGNITFQSTNVVSTAVLRDASGNFSAGTITAALTGAASSNVLKAGDTMTGSLNLTGNSSNLTVAGIGNFNQSLNVTDDLTVDSANSLFKVDTTNLRVGIKNTSPVSTFHVDGDGKVTLEGTNAQVIYRRSSDDADIIYQEYDVSASTFYTWAKNKDINFSTSSTSGKTTNHLHINSTDGKVGVGTESTSVTALNQVPDLQVSGLLHATGSLVTGPVANNATGSGSVTFLGGATGGSGARNFIVGAGLAEGVGVFEITASATNGGKDWKNLGTEKPAIAVRATDNAVAINTDAFSGTDTTVTPNVNRTYALNLQGDININGSVFQDNAEFVTSRWTASPNLTDIYRGSKVGINFTTAADPNYELEVNGGIGMTGLLYVNDDPLWLDTYGIIKVNRQLLDEDVTIPANTNASSAGPLVINTNRTITITAGSSWSIT